MPTLRPLLLFLMPALIALLSCADDHLSTSPQLRLSFSADTVTFDTVFTTIGSATQHLRVYNRNRQSVQVSSIRLAGGEGSFFRMNVNGVPTRNARDVLIRGGDSIFIFVEVTVDPTLQHAPLLISDSIVFETNGNAQDVNLVAWGQDVHLLRRATITGERVFTPHKPYLIYDYIHIKPHARLIVEPGSRLHFHNHGALLVEGTLELRGTPEHGIVLEADRLEQFYRDKPGQWYGIWFLPGSHSNSIEWTQIKNATIGITVDTFHTPGVPVLTIRNSRVENMSGAALLGRGSIVEASNTLFANAAQVVVSLKYGGWYRFYHCTLANFWGMYMHRQGPTLLLNNFYTYPSDTADLSKPWLVEARDMEQAHFVNCIIYGSLADELEVDNIYRGSPVDARMNYLFENTILRASSRFDLNDPAHFRNVRNVDPKFINPSLADYRLDSLSPAINAGLSEIGQQFPIDLNNFHRPGHQLPDLGAFEWVPAPALGIGRRRGAR